MVVFFVLVFLSLAPSSSGTLGTVTNFYPKARNQDGSVEVVIRMKVNSLDCSLGQWQCFSGDCGNETSAVAQIVYEDDEGYCQVEQILTRRLSTNGPFEIRSNVGEGGGGGEEDFSGPMDRWRNITVVDLRTRSDSGKPNTSPQASMLPIVRVPRNCPRKYHLLKFDPDRDSIKCRLKLTYPIVCNDECATTALLPSFFWWEPCVMNHFPDQDQVGDTFRVDHVMEDFPRTNLTLTDTNGSQEIRTPGESLSKVSVQFVLEVGSSVPSCEEGLFLPAFLPPTPDHEAQLFTAARQPISIVIRFAANYSSSSALFHNGPLTMMQGRTGLKEYTLVWIPTDDDRNQHFPVCLVLQVTTMLGKHESEPRCFVVTVVKVPQLLPPTPPNGTELLVSVNQAVIIFIVVETPSPPQELVFSGPENMRNTTLGPGRYILFWIPSEADEGRRFTISFYVIFSNNIFSEYLLYNYYQSEFQTVTVVVQNEIRTTMPTSSAFIRTKIISATPLTEDFLQSQVLQQIKAELVGRGMSSEMTLRLVNRGKKAADEKPPK